MSERGLCECGCGQRTTIAAETDRRSGRVKGQPVRFIRGHTGELRRRADRWREEDRGYETPCHVWQMARGSHGYGIEHRDGRTVLAHRRAYIERYGAVPDGLELDHLCAVRECVNPDHLEPVTSAVNVRRGRRASLTMERANEIRRLVAQGWKIADVARAYGIGWSTAQHIVAGRTWRPA
jgi:hypothetical protein